MRTPVVHNNTGKRNDTFPSTFQADSFFVFREKRKCVFQRCGGHYNNVYSLRLFITWRHAFSRWRTTGKSLLRLMELNSFLFATGRRARVETTSFEFVVWTYIDARNTAFGIVVVKRRVTRRYVRNKTIVLFHSLVVSKDNLFIYYNVLMYRTENLIFSLRPLNFRLWT